MNKNSKLEDSLNKIFSSSGYKMVDVSSKEITHRKALAVGEIILGSEVIKMIKNKKMPKGDPLAIAEVSGINGVKKTSELIPLCHPLSLDLYDKLKDDLINKKVRKVQDWTEKNKIKNLEFTFKDYDPLFNINTEEDLEFAKKLSKRIKNE